MSEHEQQWMRWQATISTLCMSPHQAAALLIHRLRACLHARTQSRHDLPHAASRLAAPAWRCGWRRSPLPGCRTGSRSRQAGSCGAGVPAGSQLPGERERAVRLAGHRDELGRPDGRHVGRALARRVHRRRSAAAARGRRRDHARHRGRARARPRLSTACQQIQIASVGVTLDGW